MIPGGYEKTRRYNLQVDDFDEYDDDDDDEFILDSAYQSTAAEKQQPTGWQQTELSEMEKNINEDNSLADNNNNIRDDHIKTTTKSSFFFNDQNEYMNTANKLDDSINVIDELKSAIVCKNLAQVKSLMEIHDIDVNCLFNSTNWTPIMLAANSGAFELVEYFVRHEANVNFEHDSYNVLMCACGSPNGNEYNQVKIVDLLLNKGVDVNSCDKYEQTPLMYACRAQNFFLVDLLVKHGAKIDAQDDNGWTPLSHASYNGCLKSVKKLLRHGADPIIHTIDYLYPFDLAKKNGHTEIYQLLKNYLRMRRIEESKSNNNVLYELLDEFEDQDDGLANDRKIAEDLETFLRGLGLKNVLSLLKAHRISLKTLLNCKVDDLKKIGIKDDDNCQLIVGEIKKFHQKNWQSSALAEVNSDVNLNCIEAISIMSNLSRQIDFMASNVKYVQISGVQENKELFADEFSSVKLKNECKLAMSNCKDLMTNLNSLNSIVQANVKKDKADRIDEVPAIQSYGTTNWLKITPIKAVAFSTAAFMISSIFIVKIKRTF